MVRVRCHGKIVNRRLHRSKTGKPYIMSRKKGGGIKRLYLTKNLRV